MVAFYFPHDIWKAMKCLPKNDTFPSYVEAVVNAEVLWKYECRVCRKHFSIRVPRGPTEEKALRCLVCGSKDIRRLNRYSIGDSFCGG